MDEVLYSPDQGYQWPGYNYFTLLYISIQNSVVVFHYQYFSKMVLMLGYHSKFKFYPC